MRGALPEGALELWCFTAAVAANVEVFPDGCRDLIVSVARHAAPACFVTALADGVETATFAAGQQAVGVRMRPGARFDEQALLSQLRGRDRVDDGDLLAAIGAVVRVDAQVQEALECLVVARDLGAARAGLGVSERSLERLLTARTGRSPGYWKNLARARRCARALFVAGPLAEIAVDHGYADQAHMTRDIRRWFGAPPSRLRNEPTRFVAVAFSGHG